VAYSIEPKVLTIVSKRHILTRLTTVVSTGATGLLDAVIPDDGVSLTSTRSAESQREGGTTKMYNLTFEFSIEKLVHSIAYFSQAGIHDLTKLKVAKLLYFADKQHLLEYGTPIIGDVYWCMDWGPVPSFALNEMNEAIGRQEVSLPEGSDAKLFVQILNVKKPFFCFHPRFEVKDQAYNSSVFSQSELQALGYTASVYGAKTARELVDLTHGEPTWIVANQVRTKGSRSLITYDLFFQGAPEKSQRLLAKLVAEQYGAAIPLAGDTGYAAFASELASYEFKPDEIDDSDVRSRSRYSRA